MSSLRRERDWAAGQSVLPSGQPVRYPSGMFRLSVLCGLVAAVSGCAGTHARSYSTVGGLAGAASGALIGAASGNAGEGALIGLAAGGLGGAALGASEDRRDERFAIQQASYEQAAYAHAAGAVTTTDLITMSQSGVGDAVIRSMLLQRGSRVDLSPGGVVFLKQNGVSDAVILAAQQAAGLPEPPGPPVGHYGPPPVVIHEAPVFVRPVVPVRPGLHISIGGRRRRCR